jgi:hypothetical protein
MHEKKNPELHSILSEIQKSLKILTSQVNNLTDRIMIIEQKFKITNPSRKFNNHETQPKKDSKQNKRPIREVDVSSDDTINPDNKSEKELQKETQNIKNTQDKLIQGINEMQTQLKDVLEVYGKPNPDNNYDIENIDTEEINSDKNIY